MTTQQSTSSLAPAGGSGEKDAALVYVFILAVVALLVSVTAIGFGLRADDESGGEVSAGGSTATPEASLSELKISPGTLTGEVGGTIRVTNDGGAPHNLAIEGTDLRTPMLDAGGGAELALTGLEPGTYVAFCEVPGHREAGMEAELTVTEAGEGGSEGTGAAGEHAAHGGGEDMTAEEMDELMAQPVEKFPAATKGTGAQELAPKVLADGTKEFALTVDEVKWEVEPGKFVDAMAYNGQVPGPTVRVEPGDKVRFVVTNEMEESTAVHFHGVEIPNALDGVPDITQPPIKPGATYVYEWTTQRTPAVGMYHSHHNAQVQVPNGLFAAFLIGRVPTAGPAPTSEHVMVLNDAGTIGFSLNGKSFPATAPYAAKVGDRLLFHYMNEGVMAHPMHLHGMPQLVVAKDGFPLEQPYLADTVNVAPGERYTVLVEVTVPGVWAWHCHILPHAERSTGMFGMVTALIAE